MAQWRPMSYKIKQSITNLGDGINTGVPALSIKDSEVSYLREMDSKDYPSLSVRPGRYVKNFAQSTDVRGVGYQQSGFFLNVVNGNTVTSITINGNVVWATLSTTLSTGVDGNFSELQVSTQTYTIYMNSTNKKYWLGTSTALDISDTNLPATNIFATHKGRVYAGNGNVLYYSALNSVTDWTTANDAGSIVITNSVGGITALTEYDNKLIIFALRSMHILYGSGPGTYEVYDVENTIGCISHRSVTKCNGNLYWIAFDGVYEYNGSIARRISDPIQSYVEGLNFSRVTITDIMRRCSGDSIDRYVYFAVPYSGSTNNNLILKYDTIKKIWFIENGNISIIRTVANILHGVDYDGNILNMRSTNVHDKLTTGGSEAPISWNFITKPFTEDSVGGVKTLSELNVIASISTASTAFSIGYSTNIENNDSTTFIGSTAAGSSDPYVLFTTNAGSSNTLSKRIQVPVDKLQNVPWYRLRFAGSGPATVNFLEKNLRIKRR